MIWDGVGLFGWEEAEECGMKYDLKKNRLVQEKLYICAF